MDHQQLYTTSSSLPIPMELDCLWRPYCGMDSISKQLQPAEQGSALWQPYKDLPSTIIDCDYGEDVQWNPFPIRTAEQFEAVDRILIEDPQKWDHLVSENQLI